MRRVREWALVAAALLAQPAWAANINVTDAWVRATVPGQKVSGAYMQIQADADARLVGVASPAAGRVEMHEMNMDGGVMRMRELKSVPLPKGKTVVLAPGGYHLMLMALGKPIAAGDIIPFTLTVESAGRTQQVKIEAEARGMRSDAPHHSH